MNTRFTITPEIYIQASEEAAGYYRILLNWLNNAHEKNAEDIDSTDIKKLYKIHKKLHHRLLIILLGMAKDEHDLLQAQKYNQILLCEQKELIQIMVNLNPKTLLQAIRGGMKTSSYMKQIADITNGILDKWGLNESGTQLIYSPIE